MVKKMKDLYLMRHGQTLFNKKENAAGMVRCAADRAWYRAGKGGKRVNKGY